MKHKNCFYISFTLFLLFFVGCASPIALHRAVIEYDRSVAQIESELLLLNIARARNNEPIHFTAVSSIAATFDFSVNTSFGGSIVENPGLDTLTLSFGSSASENPTVSIIPVQGEQFTRRLLTPMDETKLEFLIHQGIEPALILRLIARGIVLNGYGESGFLLNMPHKTEEYKEFRKRVLHLSALNYARNLHVGPIHYNDEKERITGRIAITNYPLKEISQEERKRLDEEAHKYPLNHVLVDIRPDYPGGAYPLYGMIKLRSFKAVLNFLGTGISHDEEFQVNKDPRTGEVLRNPSKTMNINISENKPQDAIFPVKHHGAWYWLENHTDTGKTLPNWDLEAFDVLYQLFQMTVTDVTRVPTTPIPISK